MCALFVEQLLDILNLVKEKGPQFLMIVNNIYIFYQDKFIISHFMVLKKMPLFIIILKAFLVYIITYFINN